MARRIVVTGGSGFIGTNVVEHHRRAGDDVTNLDIAPPRSPEHRELWRNVDLCESRSLNSAIEELEPEVVYHLGARTDLNGRSVAEYEANTEGVANLVAALLRVRAPQAVIFASSMLVCRIGYRPKDQLDYCPSTAYGESKVEGERIVREEAADRFPWVILRPTSIWGPWFGAPYRDLFTAVERGWYVHPKGRRIRRNYGFVLNSVAQMAALVSSGCDSLAGSCAYLADYEPIELKDWADRLQVALGVRPVRELPLWFFRSAAVVGDIAKGFGYRLPPMSSYRLNNILTEMLPDTAPMQSIVPSLPHSLDDGIRITVDWLRQHK